MTEITTELDINYDQYNGLYLDVYRPTSTNDLNQRAIIAIHGGGWYQGDKHKEADWAKSFAENGYTVFVPNYRLAPDNIFPAAIDDMLNLYDWLENSEYEFDRSKVGAIGMSAGGNLAIELAIRKHIPIASWSGIIDIEKWIAENQSVKPSNSNAPDPNTPSDQIDQSGLDNGYYKWFILNYVNSDPVLLKKASPIYRIDAKTGPMFLANSLNELVPMSGMMAIFDQLNSFSIPATLMTLTGSRHGKAYFDDAIQPTFAFFDKYLQ